MLGGVNGFRPGVALRWWWVAFLAMAACGRVGFDRRPDDAGADSSPSRDAGPDASIDAAADAANDANAMPDADAGMDPRLTHFVTTWQVQASDSSQSITIHTGSGLSESNYDATLRGWSMQAILPSTLILGADGLTYCNATGDRNTLMTVQGWMFVGDSSC